MFNGVKYFLYDINGNLKMSDIDYIGEFSCGLAVVGMKNPRDNKIYYGYADLLLNKAIDLFYDSAESFAPNGTAKVVYKGEEGIINTKNERVG